MESSNADRHVCDLGLPADESWLPYCCWNITTFQFMYGPDLCSSWVGNSDNRRTIPFINFLRLHTYNPNKYAHNCDSVIDFMYLKHGYGCTMLRNSISNTGLPIFHGSFKFTTCRFLDSWRPWYHAKMSWTVVWYALESLSDIVFFLENKNKIWIRL
jgi:hypothetical protein